ncbi:hypothetical protein B0H19DRAFT_1364950 [Mycena capillaripes]|nr:hypothetical protein B0H19DRAFT_1364950 [Mycena capillaripes]
MGKGGGWAGLTVLARVKPAFSPHTRHNLPALRMTCSREHRSQTAPIAVRTTRTNTTGGELALRALAPSTLHILRRNRRHVPQPAAGLRPIWSCEPSPSVGVLQFEFPPEHNPDAPSTYLARVIRLISSPSPALRSPCPRRASDTSSVFAPMPLTTRIRSAATAAAAPLRTLHTLLRPHIVYLSVFEYHCVLATNVPPTLCDTWKQHSYNGLLGTM